MSRANKFTIRCAGIIRQDDTILLVKSIYDNQEYWILPGGGLHAGESLREGVVREVAEETGIKVHPTRLVYMDEKPKSDKHILHFTYLCELVGGQLQVGDDPDQEENIILETKFMSVDELVELENFVPAVMQKYLLADLKGDFQRGEVINFHELDAP